MEPRPRPRLLIKFLKKLGGLFSKAPGIFSQQSQSNIKKNPYQNKNHKCPTVNQGPNFEIYCTSTLVEKLSELARGMQI